MIEGKICSKCKKFKLRRSFNLDNSRIDKTTQMCRSCMKKFRKKYSKDIQKNNRLKRMYGITLNQFNSMLKEQNYVCYICESFETVIYGRTGKVRELSVDHNHATNVVRGLLCHSCNTTIGSSKEDIQRLKGVVEYLNKHNCYCKENE